MTNRPHQDVLAFQTTGPDTSIMIFKLRLYIQLLCSMLIKWSSPIFLPGITFIINYCILNLIYFNTVSRF